MGPKRGKCPNAVSVLLRNKFLYLCNHLDHVRSSGTTNHDLEIIPRQVTMHVNFSVYWFTLLFEQIICNKNENKIQLISTRQPGTGWRGTIRTIARASPMFRPNPFSSTTSYLSFSLWFLEKHRLPAIYQLTCSHPCCYQFRPRDGSFGRYQLCNLSYTIDCMGVFAKRTIVTSQKNHKIIWTAWQQVVSWICLWKD